PPPVPAPLPWWYKSDAFCAFHQGAPGHGIEHCLALKNEVQRLMRANILSFKDLNPNVQANPLPKHVASSVNMVNGCPGTYMVFDIQRIRESLVRMHINLCNLAFFQHNHAACAICPRNPRGCQRVRDDIQGMLDRRELTITYKRNENDVSGDDDVFVITPEFSIPKPVEVTFNSQNSVVTPLVICPPGPIPYTSNKAIPYKYNATMIEDGREVPIPPLPSAVNIAEVSRVTRSGRLVPAVSPDKVDAPVNRQVQLENPIVNSELNKELGQSSRNNVNSDFDEVLKLIKKSEYKVVDQLMQTPSKISILSLLLNSDAHREALMKVLDQAFVDHDVTIGRFGGIVGNITTCNNLSFSDEELPEEGRNHNLALHISMNCQSDMLSNVLVDTGSSLNVMPKTTLARLSYQGTPMRYSGLVVKAFDGSKKPVIGEVDLPMMIGPHSFQITFQVMDIQAAYSCLLGRPWIHEAGAVTSTLHQKLKFVKNGKLVTVSGEQALLVSHLSSFSFISVGDVDGTQFQGLSLDEKNTKKNGASICSLKDAQEVVQNGLFTGWGKVVTLLENKHREGLGFSPSSARAIKTNVGVKLIKDTFYSAGFIHPPSPEANAIIEDDSEEDSPSFVTHGVVCQNWIAIDIPYAIHISKLIIDNPIKHNNPMPSPNFEFPVFKAENEDGEEIPDEISRLLKHEGRVIQPHEEPLEVINLGSEEDKKEVRIGALLDADVKNRLTELLKEYVDVFAWSYQDMPGLDTDIVEHRLPLKPEFPPVKQKLRRTHPDLAVKIKEEVQKQIDAGFLVTCEYPQWLANIVPVPKKDGKVRMCVDYRDLNK
ncbi:hypothetical protein TSUD_418590, partial [Trifolium subterraneum]